MIKITPNKEFNISDYGFDVKGAFSILEELKL
jgi:hypothetical protein